MTGRYGGFYPNLPMPTLTNPSRETVARRELTAAIREKRRVVGWSIEDLASRIGTTEEGARRLERAALDVPVALLLRACMELGVFANFRRFLRYAGWVGRGSSNSHEIAPALIASPSEAARARQRFQPVVGCSIATWNNLSDWTSCDLQVSVRSDPTPIANNHFRYQDGEGWAEIVPSKGSRLHGSLPWKRSLAQKTLGSSQVRLMEGWKDPFLAGIFQSRASGWGERVIRQCHQFGCLAPITGVAGFDLPLYFICAVPDVARAGSFRVNPINTAWDAQGSIGDFSSKAVLPHKSSLERVQHAVNAVLEGQADQGELGLTLVTTTALPGSRPKASCVGLSGELYVAKLHLPGDPVDMVALEMLSVYLAWRLGVRVALPERQICDMRFVLVYKRFDRDGQNRRGVFSARSLLGQVSSCHELVVLDAGDMFLLTELIKTHCSGYGEVGPQIFKRLMFMILIGTPGDILRKLVFLEVEDQLLLAPAVGLRIELHGLKSPDALEALRMRRLAGLKTLITCSQMLGVDASQAKSILSGQRMMLRSWSSHARGVEVGMTPIDAHLLKQTMDAIDQDAGSMYMSL